MANVEHAAITDPNIHEPKGIATAEDGQVYVADGAGSGEWTDADTLFTAGQWTMNDLVHVKYESNSAQELPDDTWTTAFLNQVKTNNLTSVSLSSNRISLPAGTYYVDASVPCVMSSSEEQFFKAKLYNVTAGSDLVIGTFEGRDGSDLGNTGDVLVRSIVKGVFTVASTSNVELRGYSTRGTNFSHTGNSEGSAVSVQSEITIWRIA